MAFPIVAALTLIGEGFKTWWDGRQKIKEKKVDVQIAKYEAEATRFRMQAQIEADWDMEAMRQSQYSWKDEWLTLILSIPYIMSFVVPFIEPFIPGVTQHYKEAWLLLDQTPTWYQVSFLGIVAASFGLRWWFTNQKIGIVSQKVENGA